MLWSKIEQIIGENIPMCIQKILLCCGVTLLCGYDTMLSLQSISVETVNRIEKHVNEHRNIIQDINCCHETFYKQQTVFKFLPGHCDLLITLSSALSKTRSKIDFNSGTQNESKCESVNQAFNFAQAVEHHPNLSVILKEMIKTALRNAKYVKNSAQYTNIIRYFATYIYIIGGRSCYEVLYKNLPLPSVSTVCKFKTFS